MAFTKVEDWSETAASNTEINGIVLSDSTQIDALDNIEREHMAQIAKWVGDDTVASAATADLGAVPGRYINITGTTTITAFGTIKAGTVKYVKFGGALTLTHNATSLILPGAANITTAAGDTAVFVSEGSGNWRCLVYQRASGIPVGDDTSTTDNAVVRYNGTGGKQQNSSLIVDDSGHISSFGGQIKFPASQSASADANTLDDYEEGTFTPTVKGTSSAGTGTYLTQSGRYTKVGDTVFFRLVCVWTNSTGTGNLSWGGLPFNAEGGTNRPAVSIVASDIALTASNTIAALKENSNNDITAQQMPVGGGTLAAVPLDTAGTALIAGEYWV